MKESTYTDFEAAQPYFDLVREALGNLVEGEHFFDVVTDDTIYEVLYELGWPRIIKGRTDLMDAFRGYCEAVKLQSADHLTVHVADNGRVVVIEYEVQGTILSSGAKYNNRFCSVIAIDNQKIAHWRDYMDSLAAWKAMTAPEQEGGRR
jgi:ketosteroid isomerase-like protein